MTEVAAGLTCPAARCGAENELGAEVCLACLTPLAGYGRLSMHPNALFNRGLRAARADDAAGARELFAAVVLWQPHDLDARNAHALACLEAGDPDAARSGWEAVLARSPGQPLAARGLAWLSARSVAVEPPAPAEREPEQPGRATTIRASLRHARGRATTIRASLRRARRRLEARLRLSRP